MWVLALIFIALPALAQSPETQRLLDASRTSVDAQKYAAAVQQAQQAVELARANSDQTGLAAALNQLSNANRIWHKLNDALAAAKQAESAAMVAGNRPLQLRAQVAAGEAERDKGDLGSARAAFESALDGFRKSGDRHGEATALAMLSTVFRLTAERDRATEIGKRALALSREIKDQTVEAQALYTLGNIALEQQKYELTLTDLNALLALPSITNVRRVQTLQGVETAYCILGQVEKCKQVAYRQLDLAKAGGDPWLIAWAYFKMGMPLRMSGAHEEALETALKAVAQLREVDHIPAEEWYFVAAAGERMGDLGRYREEADYLQQAIDIVEKLRDGFVHTEQSKAASESDVRPYYDELIRTLYRFDPARAFQVTELARARDFLETLAESKVDLRQGLSESQREREKALASRISDAERIVRRQSTSEAARKLASADLNAAEEEMERFRLEIRRSNPRLAAIQYPKPLGLEEIQRSLKPGTVLLEYSVADYAVGDAHAYVWAVTRDRWTTAMLPARKEIDALISAYRKSLGAPVSSLALRQAESETARLSAQLYDVLVKPVEGYLAGSQSLVIIPDGTLYYVPFETLASSGKYLLERFPVSYAASATTFEIADPPAPQPKELLAFGDPAYTRTQISAERGFDLGALPYTREEVNGIAALFPADTRSIYLGANAREKAVTSEALDQYRYLHFATHGLLDEAHPDRSGLALTPGKDDDGVLRVDAITNMRLRADVVTLSACNTGLGQLVSGEGMLGLVRAFLYAGAASVNVSLWNVNDAATAALMKEFYRNLSRSAPPAEALRDAKIALLHQDNPLWRHPHYWAPFVLWLR